MNRPILKDIERSDELMRVLNNVSDYTDAQIVQEAKHVLLTFYESGHVNNEARINKDDESHCWAMKNIRELNKIIAKKEAIHYDTI